MESFHEFLMDWVGRICSGIIQNYRRWCEAGHQPVDGMGPAVAKTAIGQGTRRWPTRRVLAASMVWRKRFGDNGLAKMTNQPDRNANCAQAFPVCSRVLLATPDHFHSRRIADHDRSDFIVQTGIRTCDRSSGSVGQPPAGNHL